MENDIQIKKKRTMQKQVLAFSLIFLFITLSIPSVSAGWFSNAVGTVSSWFSSAVSAVKSFFGGGSSSSSSANTIGGTSTGGGGSSDYYNPNGKGYNIGTPEVEYSPPVIQTVEGSDALWYDVDIIRADLICLNCPQNNQEIAGFDYLLEVELVNKGNYLVDGLEFFVELEMPDGEIRSYEFTGSKSIALNAGTAIFDFPIKSLGMENNELKDYTIQAGNNDNFEIKFNAEIKNDKGVFRLKPEYKYTPQRVCSWEWNGFIPKYICKEENPSIELFGICPEGEKFSCGTGTKENDVSIDSCDTSKCTITEDDVENNINKAFILDTIKPTLYAGGSLGGLN